MGVICGARSPHTEQAAGKGFFTAPTSPVPEMTGGSLGKAPAAMSVRILARVGKRNRGVRWATHGDEAPMKIPNTRTTVSAARVAFILNAPECSE